VAVFVKIVVKILKPILTQDKIFSAINLNWQALFSILISYFGSGEKCNQPILYPKQQRLRKEPFSINYAQRLNVVHMAPLDMQHPRLLT
jgi:hypothetical protein